MIVICRIWKANICQLISPFWCWCLHEEQNLEVGETPQHYIVDHTTRPFCHRIWELVTAEVTGGVHDGTTARFVDREK